MSQKNNIELLFGFIQDYFLSNLVSVIQHSSNILHRENLSHSNLLVIVDDSFQIELFYERIIKEKNIYKIFLQTDVLFMKQTEIIASCDIFPIEYLEIIDTEISLFGKKLANLVSIDKINLRLQIESNARRNIILLKKAFLYDHKNLLNILDASFNDFIISMKNLLRLHEVSVKEISVRDVVINLANLIDFDIKLFFLVIRILDDTYVLKVEKLDMQDIFIKYLGEVEKIVAFIDKIEISKIDSSHE
jgi:hypothetical protein